MATLLRMPEVAANTPEATLVAWIVNENTPYSAADSIVTVETAKAAVDIEAESDGVILKTLVEAGRDVKVGEPIALIGVPGETVDDIAGTLTALGAGSGPRSDPAAGPGSDSVPAPAGPATSGQATRDTDAPKNAGARVFASPLARRLAREAGLEIGDIRGTGPASRIIRRDVEEAIRRKRSPAADEQLRESIAPMRPQESAADDGARPPAPRKAARGAESAPYEDQPHSRLRRAIAARLTESKQNAPHFYLSGVAEVDELLRLRTAINEGSPVRVSVNDLVVKAVARAHTLVPKMNVIWTPDAIRHFTTVDVAVAVATEQGLVTPVVRDADRTNLSALAATTKDYADRARAGRLQQHELEGGTITVTNLGMFGTTEFAAIINPPQAAILAVGAATPSPVVRNNEIGIATTLRVTLSVDHRLVDGATAAEWMRTFVSLLEHPLQILT
jgi:pyruvate dehydrogenase E2 component (dihydrolipoamide acetyltransferase)